MGVGVASSGSGGQGFAFKLEGDGDTKLGNSDGDLHQITGSVAINENIFFLTNGRVGLGTDAPDYKLDVAGNIGLNQYLYHNGDANTRLNLTEDRIQIEAGGLAMIGAHQKDSAPHQVTINNGSNNVDFVVKDNSNNQIISVDASTSRLGVNTDAPTQLLHVHGGNLLVSGNDARVKIDGHVDSHPGVEFFENGTRKWIIFNNYGDDSLDFKTDSNTRMVINQDGTVGIGTESPAALLSVAGVISSSHGATLGNLILQDDTTSLQVSGTISSSAGATLGNLILQDDATSLQLSGTLVAQDISSSVGSTLGNLILNDDATSLQLSGTLVAQDISSSVGSTLGNLILNDDSTSLQLSGAVLMSDKGAFGNTAIYDATGSSVTRVTGTLDIKGHHVQAITRTDLGNGATSTITGTTGVHFLDASEVTTGAGGTHIITVSTGTLDGQYLVLAITGTINNTTVIAGNSSVAASGEITFTGTASDNQTLTIKDTSGNAKTVTTSTSVSCGSAVRGDASSQVAGINGCPNAAFTAAAIYTAIAAGISSDSWPFTLDPGFSAGVDTSFTISQNVVGAGGNQTITSNLSNVSVTGFSGGGVSLGTVNSDNGIAMGYNQINGPVVHLIFDTRSNQWQPISANHITS